MVLSKEEQFRIITSVVGRKPFQVGEFRIVSCSCWSIVEDSLVGRFFVVVDVEVEEGNQIGDAIGNPSRVAFLLSTISIAWCIPNGFSPRISTMTAPGIALEVDGERRNRAG